MGIIKYSSVATFSNGYNCSCCRRTWKSDHSPKNTSLEEIAKYEAEYKFHDYLRSNKDEFDERFIERLGIVDYCFLSHVKIIAHEVVENDIIERDSSPCESFNYKELVKRYTEELIKKNRNNSKLREDLFEFEGDLKNLDDDSFIKNQISSLERRQKQLDDEKAQWNEDGVKNKKNILIEKIRELREKLGE